MKTVYFVILLCALGAILLTPTALEDVLRPVVAPRSAEVLFVGDIMLDRLIRFHGERVGYERLTEALAPLFLSADGAIGNLEGPVTDNESVSLGSLVGDERNTRFTFSPRALSALVPLKFIALSLGNNHSFDFGPEGVTATEMYLRHAGITSFGAVGKNRVARIRVHGVSLSLVSFNQFGGDRASSTAALIQKERDTRLPVIVFAHWGEEYQAAPTEEVRSFAHQFAEAGAALVVGAHPHVIGEKEMYQGTMIYYSLGNFIFDQYFSDETRCGLILRARITPQGLTSVEELYVRMAGEGRTIPDMSCAQPKSFTAL